jgi:hypothetical protein
MDDELKGVKGWLLAFVVIIALISPGWAAVSVYRELYTGQAAYLPDVPMITQIKAFFWATVAIRFALGWFVAWRLLAVENWRSVQIAIVCIWLVSVGGAIVEYAGLTYITGLSFSDVLAEAGPRGIIQPVGFALIWTAYLLKSERVQNTYRGGEEQAEVFE